MDIAKVNRDNYIRTKKTGTGVKFHWVNETHGTKGYVIGFRHGTIATDAIVRAEKRACNKTDCRCQKIVFPGMKIVQRLDGFITTIMPEWKNKE